MSPRLLVVDDEQSLLRGLTYALERERYEVVTATDGEGAFAAASSQAFDLIVLDLMLPKLSGLDVCRMIRDKSDVPIIILTARDSKRELVEGLEAGADDYVTKPFFTTELLSRISALLRRRGLDRVSANHVVRTIGSVTIDYELRQVAVDGRAASLTPSEFKILALLSTAPGAVFSRRQIMEHLWGSTHVGDEHTCEVHISSLRRKIERDANFSSIRLVTVRGIGYSLIDDHDELTSPR